ncbi:hypothetical protein [Pseudomonas brassicacearum]|uniref:hypothetical protein n=1 Tax=Pseudomonas brassicacearum TaxID=930166 RepID=UPI002733738C|nr:hypothetical protein [Pseudomonas brassicacearum]WLG66265.1 hypothetical protein PSH71_19865 [Pseudomonas brassicacearum]
MTHPQALPLLSLALLLSACATTQGPSSTLNKDGPLVADKTKSGLTGRFATSEYASRHAQADDLLAHQMLEDGYALIYANCDLFFASAGQTQRWLMVTRDTVGAVGTMAASVMALHDVSNNAVANVALATGLTFSGLDIYTKNFLFAAENIDAVRELTTHALNVHINAVGEQTPLTYASTSVHLLDNQNICTPASILALVRQAIKKGDVEPTVDRTYEQPLAARADEAALAELGALLNPPGSLSVDQAGALWWLYMTPTSAAQKKQIAGLLNDLPATGNPFDTNQDYQAGWAKEAQVRQALSRFSPTTKSAFASTIKKGEEEVKALGAAAPLPPMRFNLPVSSPRAAGRVSVDIR